MSRLIRILLWLVAAVVVLAVAAWFWAGRAGEITAVAPPDPTGFAADQVELGGQLAAVGDCVVCHTAPDGPAYAGGLPLPTPFGTVYSTNITPDPETGIGTWSEAAFVRAMREGLDRKGNHLYPVFPYDHFARVTDADLSAIYAYLMSQPAVQAPAVANQMRFPFGMRRLLAGWKLLHLDPTPWQPDPALSDEANRGRYLVEGLGHCGACHTPRTALGGIDPSRPFAGAEAEGWFVPAIGAASTSPAPWSQEGYEAYLFDGWDEAHGIAAGPMTSVVDGLYDANEDDVFAMAVYLGTLTPEPDPAALQAAMDAAAALDWAEDEKPGGASAPQDAALLAGEAVFAANCAKCHKARIAETQPVSLALSAVVNAPDARNIVRIIRHGIVPPYGARQRKMDPLGDKLSDEDIAAVAAFVRWRFTDLPPWQDIAATLAEEKATEASAD